MRCVALQIPSQLVAEHVGLPYWLGFLMVGWGITATLMAGLTSSPTHLYLLRFFLGLSLTPALALQTLRSMSGRTSGQRPLDQQQCPYRVPIGLCFLYCTLQDQNRMDADVSCGIQGCLRPAPFPQCGRT